MAFLNASERQQLREELRKLTFHQAKRKLHRLDPKARLAYLRNSQSIGLFHTRFDLVGMGTRVIFVERFNMNEAKGKHFKSDFELVDVIVEPMPENKL